MNKKKKAVGKKKRGGVPVDEKAIPQGLKAGVQRASSASAKSRSLTRKGSGFGMTTRVERIAADEAATPTAKDGESRMMKIGILAVQGDFAAHAARLRELGAETVEVRTVADLEGCDGVILPGGESTTQLQFLQEEGLFEVIKEFSREGGAVFGTCAGAILLATDVENPKQDSLGLLDMKIQRNGYGRQLASDVFFGHCALKTEPLEMVFIRGPVIEEVGEGVKVLAAHEGKPALVERDNVLAATFHPELTDDPTVHQHFLEMAKAGTKAAVGS